LQEVLDRALAKTADDRFQEPKEFAAAFSAALEDTSNASTIVKVTRVSKAKQTAPPAPWKYWRQVILAGALIAFVGGALFFNDVFPAAATMTPTVVPPSDTPSLFADVSLGPTGVLQFHDANAILDQATLIAEAMLAPPAGSKYEVWLLNGEQRLSLGFLSVDGEGRGRLSFDDPRGSNLLATYDAVEIAIKINNSSASNDSERIAYFYALPDAELAYLRELMVSAATAPGKVGLIQGLAGNAELLDRSAGEMLSVYESGDEIDTRKNAEDMLNLLVGGRSQDYKDWNNDGQTGDPGDGYGFLLNSDNLGYIRAVYSQADYAVNASGASRNIIVNGENVKACAQNLARWAPELREQLLTILNASALTDMDQTIQHSAALADQMLNGIDLNENGTVEPVSGECGIRIAYESTYHMADMPLLPVNPFETPTALTGVATSSPTATPTLLRGATATSTRRTDNSPTNAPTVQPPNPHPTQRPRPTARPRPTKNRP
jgi:hypothetical protein